MAGKIFISYRRSGSPKDAYLVFHHLSSVFGAEQVFMDVNGIRPGDDFVEVLEQQLADCNVLLALIGPDWLHAKNEHGGRKLDDEDDFVRVEIRTALQRRMRIVPLLLDGAPMPRRVDLPEDLHPMVRRQGLAVDATNLHLFRSAMGRLEEVLRQQLSNAVRLPNSDETFDPRELAVTDLPVAMLAPRRSPRSSLKALASQRTSILISYSHKDKDEWLPRFQNKLAPLSRHASLDIWDDTRIRAGDDWAAEIDKALQCCKVALLLISDGFLASKFIAEKEFPHLLTRHREGGMRLYPILLKDCMWELDPVLARIQIKMAADSQPLEACVADPAKLNAEMTGIARDVLAIIQGA